MEQIKKYIRGNSERGSDVIAELERLGGKNALKLNGNDYDSVYYIERYKYTNVNTIDFVDKKSFIGQLILTHPEWEEIKLPEQFKDGDVVYVKTVHYDNIIVYKKLDEYLYRYVNLSNKEHFRCNEDGTVCAKYEIQEIRLATEEEKQKLFDAIKANGYKWNPKTKTLEELIEPEFNMGDVIRYKRGNRVRLKIESININEQFYYTSNKGRVYFKHQDDWELVPNKFDISTLVPFESEVLVRQLSGDYWRPAFWGDYNKQRNSIYSFLTTFGLVRQCIPYECNEHLLGTTNDCDKYYKTWED